MHACQYRTASPVQRVQRIGAQTVVGTFSVATCIAEAEAHITSTQDRFWKRAIKMWTDMHTLPETHPLRKSIAGICKSRRQHRSPFYPVAETLKDIPMERLETIEPFTLAPWESRIKTIVGQPADERGETSRTVEAELAGRNGLRGANRCGQLSQERSGGNRRSDGDEADGTKRPQVRTMSSPLEPQIRAQPALRENW